MSILVQIRSLSLSLDSLLDYTEKDVEESTLEVCLHVFIYLSMQHFSPLFVYGIVADSERTFSFSGLLFLQLSLFAESFYEMLQFQMGSRILTFLQVGYICFC